ncbi:MAG: DeoR/GlpR family DNA-binding transcription regulator [Streptomycetales bacterium]
MTGTARRHRSATTERRARVLGEVLAGHGGIHQLAAHFGVSPSTVRRDLGELVRDGQVTRTYGGAVHASRAVERSLGDKELGRRAEKDAIARTAARLVEEGAVIVLDAGSTTGRLARQLRRRRLTVITTGLNSLFVLAGSPEIDLIVPGGRVRHRNGAILGPPAEDLLRRLEADTVFLGADGVTPGGGLSSPSLEQAHLKYLMLHRARQVVVLADHSKLGRVPFPYRTPLDRAHTLVTDSGADDATLVSFRGAGCEVVVAPRSG